MPQPYPAREKLYRACCCECALWCALCLTMERGGAAGQAEEEMRMAYEFRVKMQARMAATRVEATSGGVTVRRGAHS